MRDVDVFLDSLNIIKNDTLIIGVSFGPDSMFLLHLLKNKYKNNKIVCAHVHHNHRKESDEEALKLEEYCKNNGIIFEMMKIKKYKDNKFTEEEARNKRYDFFDCLVNKYKSKYLFTAHHGDDLMETILMRLVRGSTLKGYSGISQISKRKNYTLVRPLLYLTKEYIINYCDKNNISYAVDNSNFNDHYTRNRYRNHILPFLKEENKNVNKKFLDFSMELTESNNYLEKIINKKYLKIVKNKIIDVNLLLKEEEIIIKMIIRKYLYDCYKDEIITINNTHIYNIINLLRSDKTNGYISLPKAKKLVMSYNQLYFDTNNDYNDYCFVFDDYVNLPNGYIIKKIDKLDKTTNYFTAFLSNEIKLPLYVRNRLNGDKIDVLNLNGSKKVSDILTDDKVNITKRKKYPVLVDSSGNILWIPGIKKSKYDKSKQGKYDIILKYCKKED